MTDELSTNLQPRGPVWIGVLLGVTGGLAIWSALSMLFGDFTWAGFAKAVVFGMVVGVAVLVPVYRRRRT